MSPSNTSVSALSCNDPSSFSNADEIHVERIKLNWNIDFDRKVIAGSAAYELVIDKKRPSHLILDTRDLTIHKVRETKTDRNLQFTLGETVATFGQPLHISIPDNAGQKLEITIDYETSPESSALQWLTKGQTAGKRFPFLFSQCEPIHARSMLPCQDTPSTKASYSAVVTAPKALQVLMSAVQIKAPEKADGNLRKFRFEQKIPIPSYLIAIAVGELESKQIGPRSHVWAEKPFVEAAAFDFSETEEMLKAGESILGEYVWGVYDILVLPPSFPFGGMENPCLTFATPTLLAGDKSLANVIAHEIAHSWTGNLVTNKTFEHFWLNEGFTVFTERKILGRVRGELVRQFTSIGGWKALNDTIRTMKADNPLTCLVVNLNGIDPDDSFSIVPYEKGYVFLYYLEQKVGGPSKFEPFFKEYIQTNRFKSIDTNTFKFQFIKYFTIHGESSKIQDIDWDAWLYTPGMPIVKPAYDTALADVCFSLKNRWTDWNTTTPSPFSKADISSFSSAQLEEFLSLLLDDEVLISLEKVKRMQDTYDFNSMKNCEIRFRWLRLCIQAKWEEQVGLALQFVTEQGRMKYIRPIYRDLYAWEKVRSRAIETFTKNQPSMMHVSAYTVSKDLKLS